MVSLDIRQIYMHKIYELVEKTEKTSLIIEFSFDMIFFYVLINIKKKII